MTLWGDGESRKADIRTQDNVKGDGKTGVSDDGVKNFTNLKTLLVCCCDASTY